MSDDLEDAATLASDTCVAVGPGPEGTGSRAGPRSVLPRLEQADGAVRLILEPRERYRPVKRLGEGAMGKVDLVEDQDIGRPVAVKHLIANQGLARFVQEIRTNGRLEHPNIVPIHDVGVDEQGHFFVMKYVEGETLRAVIARLDAGDPDYHARFTFQRRVQIFVGLLRALQFAHAQGVIHRDLKPENVMIGRFGEVLLMDWGVAKGVDLPAADAAEGAQAPRESSDAPLATRAGDLVGTPAYMSPEQARGDHARLDARSDLYSASVILQELLYLRHYLGERKTLFHVLSGVTDERVTVSSLMAMHHAHQPQPPAELMHFLCRGLDKDPARRFQSAEEMIERLQRNAEGEVKVQCPYTLAKRTASELVRLVDRRPIVGLIVLLSALGLGVFGLVQLIGLLR